MSNYTQNVNTVLNIPQITFKMPVQELCWEKYDFFKIKIKYYSALY